MYQEKMRRLCGITPRVAKYEKFPAYWRKLLAVAVLIGYRYDITLWDWIKLLIVPAVIAGGGLWFNVQQREREHRIASERAQDEALQGYLDGTSQLLTDKERPLH